MHRPINRINERDVSPFMPKDIQDFSHSLSFFLSFSLSLRVRVCVFVCVVLGPFFSSFKFEFSLD